MRKKKLNPANSPKVDKRMWIKACQVGEDYPAMREYASLINYDSRVLPNPSLYVQMVFERKSFVRKIWMNVVNRIPRRDISKPVSFMFKRYQRMSLFGEQYWVPQISVEYLKYTSFGKDYQPITQIEEDLKVKRLGIIKDRAIGLIRWPETLSTCDSKVSCTKDFSNFEFRINSGNDKNSLPVTKLYGSLSVKVLAPKEFWSNKFWGMGEHLIIRVLEEHTNDLGFKVAKCECMSRMELYKLHEEQERHIRYFVELDQYQGTGLSEVAAMKSLELKVSKLVTMELM
jgi:hypothetical protein